MKNSIVFFFFLMSMKFSAGQPASFTIYPGSPLLVNHAHGVFQAASGSIYLSGYGEDLTGTYSLFSFTKFDENGARIFAKYYGDSVHHFMMMRMLTIDENSFVLAGSKSLPGGNNTPYAVQVDSNGTVIWEKNIQTTTNTYFTGIAKFANGNLVMTGVTSDSLTGDLNMTGVITDNSGNVLHSFSFGDAVINETSENCVVSADGTIMVCGDRLINTSIINPYVAAFDSTGNFLWETGISSHYNSGSKNVFIDRNGDLLVVGESASPTSTQFDILLSKVDVTTGTMKWLTMIPGTNFSDAGFGVAETTDGNYAITGYGHDSTVNSKRVVFLITDTSGTELSKKYFGNSTINIGYDISPSVYGGFLMAGADFVSDRQILIYQKELGIGVDELNESTTAIYPNPLRSGSQVNFRIPVNAIQICDQSGRDIFSANHLSPVTEYTLPALANGFYVISFRSGIKTFRSALIIFE